MSFSLLQGHTIFKTIVCTQFKNLVVWLRFPTLTTVLLKNVYSDVRNHLISFMISPGQFVLV